MPRPGWGLFQSNMFRHFLFFWWCVCVCVCAAAESYLRSAAERCSPRSGGRGWSTSPCTRLVGMRFKEKLTIRQERAWNRTERDCLLSESTEQNGLRLQVCWIVWRVAIGDRGVASPPAWAGGTGNGEGVLSERGLTRFKECRDVRSTVIKSNLTYSTLSHSPELFWGVV